MDLTLTTQLLIGVTAALAATGCSTMPSAGAVSLTLVFAAVGIPLEGIGLLLAVDLPLSMTRAMVNVTGDAVGAVIINNSEQSLPLAEQIEDLDKLDHLEIPTLPETFAPHVVSQVNS